MAIDIWAYIAIGVPIILGIIGGIWALIADFKKTKAMRADLEIENEEKGEIAGIELMPFEDRGFLSIPRAEQTLIVFKSGKRVRINELLPEIEKGETWRIKWAGTQKYYPIRKFLEKELLSTTIVQQG